LHDDGAQSVAASECPYPLVRRRGQQYARARSRDRVSAERADAARPTDARFYDRYTQSRVSRHSHQSVVRRAAGGDGLAPRRAPDTSFIRHRVGADSRPSDDLSNRDAARDRRPMRPRRGVALIAALWLVVAIAAVALQFSMEAHERRAVGILASERGIQRAAALGALALTQAKLEYALRVAPTGTNVQRLAASDPWLDVESLYSGPVDVDSMQVDVRARDLGEKLNVNLLTENQLQTFFSFVLGDYAKSTQLAQSILDWRDADSIPRPNGAEREAEESLELILGEQVDVEL